MTYLQDNFLLTNKTAEKLYFNYAEKMPIFESFLNKPILLNIP